MRWIGAAACIVFVLVLWAAVDSPAAEAAPVDCNAGPNWIVSSETQLNAAIACYNTATSPGAYTITFDQDIASTGSFVSGPNTASFRFILQSAPGSGLTIDGAGFSASGSGGAQVAAFGVSIGNTGSEVTFTDLEVTGGDPAILVRSGKVRIPFSNLSGNTNGIGTSAGTTVIVTDSAITQNAQFGIVNRGKLTVSNTTVSQNNIDGIFNVGSLIVSQSSFIANSQVGVRTFNAAAILNSTIDGGQHGVYTHGGNTVISNSTIHAALDDIVLLSGSTSFRSSIVDDCPASIIDRGNNLGACFNPPSPVLVQPVADNGCSTPTPLGCVWTRALIAPTQPTGMCTGVPVLDLATNNVVPGTVHTDGRDLPRTPPAAGCDVGAFEGFVGGCRRLPGTTVVATEAELIDALDCYNLETADVGVHRIVLAADITVTGSFLAGYSDIGCLCMYPLYSSTVPIVQNNFGVTLVIDGDGHTVTGATIFDPGSEPQHDVFMVPGPGGSPVVFSNISVTGGSAAITVSGARVTVRDSVLHGNFFGIKGLSGNGLPVIQVLNSELKNNNTGIRVEGIGFINPGRLIVTGSSFIANGTGIWGSIDLIVVSNSTFHGSTIGISATQKTQAVLFNSTMRGGHSMSATQGIVVSSIVEQCTGVTDGGRNAGGCFGTAAADLGPLADNGCITPTPDGCVRTLELLAGSPGSGLGICSGVLIVHPTVLEIVTGDLTVDQRGMARTPVGAGCDAGAFEQ